MRPISSRWLVASPILVRSYEKLGPAISADVHLIIFAKGQVLRPVGPLPVLESGPCSFCEDPLGVCLSDLVWVHEFESGTVEDKDSLYAFLLADVLDVAESFSVKVQVMLRVILFLKMVGNLSQVGEEIARVRFYDERN